MSARLSVARAALGRLPRRLLMGLVQAYRLLLSPWLGASCRFEPSCSRYALAVLERHGALAGGYLTLHRLARCQPWCQGGHDPAPEQAPRLFTRLLASSSHPPAARPPVSLPSTKSPS
ncbi:MAG: membrane protein insertion efficiency factor YidD [Comamonas sp.]